MYHDQSPLPPGPLELAPMNRTQLACYFLMTSAFILGGLLIAQLGSGHLTSVAYGEQAQNVGAFSMLTARTNTNNDESLFVIDNVNSQLLVFSTDTTRKRMNLVVTRDLNSIFGTRAAPARRSRRDAR